MSTIKPEQLGSTLSRRAFVRGAALSAGATALAVKVGWADEPESQAKAKIRAGIIGHTGKGDYGHGLEMIFNKRANVEVVAIADPVPSGRAAAARSGALRQYEDYHQMLQRERPRLVCIAPRWTDQHHAMALAAIQMGAHVYMEKPITQSLTEADNLLAEAGRAGVRIAVAHQMRLAPAILHLKESIGRGLLGDLLQIRAYGKQDARAGGEDMLVLGTHLFDLIRFFAGDAIWCMAHISQNGHEMTREDAHSAKENIGPIAGDEIEAQFGFANGISASFTSRARLQGNTGHWGLELIGSKTTARIAADIFPTVFVLKAGPWHESGKADRWERLENDPTLNASASERGTDTANQRVVDDWLEAIEQNRDPICSGYAAMRALEMVMAVYHAGLSAHRVPLPLKERAHPLVAK